MYIENEPWAETIREAVGRLLKGSPDGVDIEIDGGFVFVHSQETMKVSAKIRFAAEAAVKALLPPEHQDKRVSLV